MTTATQWAVEVPRSLHQLNSELGKEPIVYSTILQVLEGLRSSCSTALLCDFNEASKEKVEDNLWDTHLKINTIFRAHLRKLNDGGNAKIVERRKLGAEYLRFIKSSQKFFRGYIKSLAVAFGGIPNLQKLTSKFTHDDLLLSRSALNTASSPTNEQILRSCFRTLVQLGDLSRYRESELAKGPPNWAHAIGFYDLARSLLPKSGISYNQLAIIALSDRNIFRAVYWLYRALSTEEPHPQADANLRRAFLKVAQLDHNGKLEDSRSTLFIVYLRTITRICAKKPSKESQNDEVQVADILMSDIRKSVSGTSIRKLFLTNFAATQYAQECFTKAQGSGNSFNSYISMLQLTLQCICSLLLVFKEQLQETPNMNEQLFSTGACSYTLPLLRLCLLWSIKNIVILTNSINSDIDSLQSKMWALHAEWMSLLLNSLPPDGLPELRYMLEEDEDTIAFLPLISEQTQFAWLHPNGNTRTIWHEASPRAEESVETLFRIRQCLSVGIELAAHKDVPVEYRARITACMQNAPSISGISLATESHNVAENSIGSGYAEADAERMVSDLVEDSFEVMPRHNAPVTPTARAASLNTTTIDANTQNVAGPGVGKKVPNSCVARNSQSPQARPLSSHKKRSPLTPSLHPAHVPMSRTVSSHSRAVSNDSVVSWSPSSAWSTTKPTLNNASNQTGQHRSSLGQAISMAEFSPANVSADYGMSSSVLFGAGQSPWSMSQPESKRLSAAREHTDGSPRLMPKPISPPTRRFSSGPGSSPRTDINAAISGVSASPALPTRWNVHAKPFK